MPLARTFIPEPPPSEHEQAPPNAASTNLPADASVWAAARRSYVQDGCSSEVVAERHGLVARTVRDHAQKEDWRGLRAAHRAAVRRMDEALAPPDPAEALLDERRAAERLRLLVAPTAAGSQAFAAHRMQEALARGGVEEALRWRRLIVEIARDAEVIDRALHGGADANERARIAYYRHLLLDEAEAEADASAAGPAATAPRAD